MSQSDKLKIVAVIMYMLNPLGILAFASQPTHSKQRDNHLASIMARHKFQSPQAVARAMGRNAATQQRAAIKTNRSPASSASSDYSCMKHLNK